MENQRYAESVKKVSQGYISSGVQGTPSVRVNGRTLDSSDIESSEALRRAIEAAPEPASLTATRDEEGDAMAWSWRLERADGRTVGMSEETFSTQADAESWLGENWRGCARTRSTRSSCWTARRSSTR